MNDLSQNSIEHSEPLHTTLIDSEPEFRPHAENLLKRLSDDLNSGKRQRVNAATTMPEPRETAIAKMAGAGITGIAETIVKDIRAKMAEVDAMADIVRTEGEALIALIQHGSAKVDTHIKQFAELQQNVQLALSQAANSAATFNGSVQ